MATKSAQQEPEKLDIEEALEIVDKTLDRVKALYEQYFLGIQKQPPTFLHTDLERKLRDLGTIQIRNTALRYRFVTVQQKFGSYHNYWRRTLRQIENGRYVRNLHKIGRKAALTGEEIPEEILAAMPKRMREQVRRDRDAALALARQRNQLPAEQARGEGDFYDEYEQPPAPRVDARGAHVLDEGDADLDLDEYFRQVADETTTSGPPPRPEPSELDQFESQFENIITPPRAAVTPPAPTPPSAPAPLRASSLGFGPRPTTSPNLRPPPRGATDPGAPVPTPPPFKAPAVDPSAPTPVSFKPPGVRTATDPGAPTPVSFKPPGVRTATDPGVPTPAPFKPPTPPASRPAFRAVETQPGVAPGPRGATEHGAAAPPATIRPPAIAPVIAKTGPNPIVRPPVDPAAPKPPPGTLPAIPQPGALPSIPQPKRPQMTEPDQQVVGARPLGRPAGQAPAPSQNIRPNPVAPGSVATTKPATVETLSGPFPRRAKRDTDIDGSVDVPMEPTPRPSQPVVARVAPVRPTPVPGAPRAPNQAVAGRTPSAPAAPPAKRPPPPGMTDADVSALYQKYVKAKEMVGEPTNPQTYGKLLNTINAQAPKIMEQYKAKGVDFSVVVKDNQVIIKAKPKP